MNKDTALSQGPQNLARELDTDIITVQSDKCSSGGRYKVQTDHGGVNWESGGSFPGGDDLH